jgi:hypothetical protein
MMRQSPEDRWQQWANRPRTAQVEQELVSIVEEMAKHAPQAAMDLAANEPNLRSRELLRQAALRGWASTAPDAALAAAMKLPGVDNRSAIAAVLQGAAGDPATVMRLGRQITDGSDPVAIDYGNLAIAALAERGRFEDALRFASGGNAANRARWLNEAFTGWARAEPQQALAALDRVTDPELRREALQGVISGWAETDPASLADHALHETDGEIRTMELGQTLTNWAVRDPAAASQWLSQRERDPNLDQGLATVAMLPTLVSQRPDVATEWAEAISDPNQRQSALRAIGEEWRRRSPAALEQYLQNNPQLDEGDRAALAGIGNPGG